MSDPNVVILSADSLRYDRAADPDLMPYVRDLASEALEFTDAVSTAGFTPGSFPAMMASRYPSSIDGIGIPAEGGVTTLAEELDANGYECGVWSDNKFVGEDYNYDRGYTAGSGYDTNLRDNVREHLDEDGALFTALEFGYMHVWNRLKNAFKESHYYSPAESLHGEVRGWLDERNSSTDSVHLWVHYMDTHHPYEPPADWMPDDLETVEGRTEANNVTRRVCASDGKDCTDAEIRDARRLYDAECRYLDRQIESFVEDYLKPQGWLTEDDILIVTSDHGEIVEDYETWGEFGHGNYFCEECTRVPLLLRAPGIEPSEAHAPVSLVDLVPTVLDVLEFESPRGELLMGTSLLADDRDERIFYDGTLGFHGARIEGRKRFNDETVGEERFRTTRYDDEGERVVEESFDDLESFTEGRVATCSSMADEAQAIDPDSLQVEQHMRDLGYLE